jgi:3-methyl-2-oxobutanoate hydroxymethyltransferase
MAEKKLTRFDLQKIKDAHETAVWITAYDYWTAQFAEKAGMDMILVGDSLGMCIYGYEGTIPVTMDQCIYHSEAVRRGPPIPLLSGICRFYPTR